MLTLTALLRTVVPYAWGLVVTWLVTALPVLEPLQDDLNGLATFALPALSAVIAAAWYAGWAWLQPRLPSWLVRAALGSSKAPVYVGKHDATAAVSADVTAPAGAPRP